MNLVDRVKAGLFPALLSAARSVSVFAAIVLLTGLAPQAAFSVDVSSPSVPAGLIAAPAASSASVNLSWSASTDNVGVTGYNVYRGSVKVSASTSTSYANSGLAAWTTYFYAVSAFDAAGNESSLSVQSSATARGCSFVGGGGGSGLNYDATKPAMEPQLAVFGTSLYASWHERGTGAAFQIRMRRLDASSWTWVDGGGSNGLNYDASKTAYSPQLAEFGTSLYAAWYEVNATTNQIRVRVYDGASWTAWADGGGASGINYNSARGAINPQLTVFGGALYAAWQEYDPSGISQIRVKKYDGTSWAWADGGGGEGLNLDTTKRATWPQLTVFDGKLYAAWQEQGAATSDQVRVRMYDESSSTWAWVDKGGLNYLATNNGDRAQLTVFNGQLYATWREGSDPSNLNYQIRVKRYDGTSWWWADDGGSAGINHNGGGHESQLTVSGNALYAIWAEEFAGQIDLARQVRLKKYDGTSWAWADGGGSTGINYDTSMMGNHQQLTVFNGSLYATWWEKKTSTSIAQVRVAVFDQSSQNDVSSPTAPSGLSAAAASSWRVDLSWSASSDDVGVTGYNVYRNGVKVATSTAASYKDYDRAAATLYAYAVSAFDAAGNESTLSAQASATTLSRTIVPLSGGGAHVSGYAHSLFVCPGGGAKSAGSNSFGQLGSTGTGGLFEAAPIALSTPTGLVAASAGGLHSIFLKDDGTVWAGGFNDYGQLGDGTNATRSAPVQSSGLTGIVAVDAGAAHSLYLKQDGTVWASGRNDMGELCNGTTVSVNVPFQVPGLSGVAAVSAGGAYSLFLKDDGTVWACGLNLRGELGNGTTATSTTPAQVLVTNVAAISAGYHSLFLKNDGTVWASGINDQGQLCNGSTSGNSANPTPAQIGSLANVAAVSVGGSHSLFLKGDGTVWSCGYNDYGQLGDASTSTRTVPVQISSLAGVTAVAGGSAHSLFLKNDGTTWSSGYNVSGQLGDGTTSNRSTPVQVAGSCAPSDTTPPSVSITSPAGGSVISGSTTVAVSASDNVGVAKVELYVDGVLKSSMTASPYAFGLDSSQLAPGSHALQAKAYDAAGNAGTSASVSISVVVPVLSNSYDADGVWQGVETRLYTSDYTNLPSSAAISQSIVSGTLKTKFVKVRPRMSDFTTTDYIAFSSTFSTRASSASPIVYYDMDETAKLFQANGWSMVPMISYVQPTPSSLTDTDLTRYANFADWFVTRYKSLANIQYVELVNAPAWEWGGTDAQLLTVSNSIYDRIKSKFPDVQVGTPGFEYWPDSVSTTTRQADYFIDNGAKFDFWAFHGYAAASANLQTVYPPTKSGVSNAYAGIPGIIAIRQRLDSKGWQGRPIVDTERTGVTYSPQLLTDANDQRDAAYMAQEILLKKTLRYAGKAVVTGSVALKLEPHDSATSFGTLLSDGSSSKNLTATAVLWTKLSSYTYVSHLSGAFDDESTPWVEKFHSTGTSRQFYAFFKPFQYHSGQNLALDGQTSSYSLQLPQVPLSAILTDVNGTASVVTPSQTMTLSAVNSPQYLEVTYTPDTTPPSVPAGLSATVVSSTRVDLSWSASTDNMGVAGYRIRRDGVVIVTTTTTAYFDSSLSTGTRYAYTVSAYDDVGNESSQSSSVSTATWTPTPSAPSQPVSTLSSSTLTLSWSANGIPNGTSYYAQISTVSNFTPLFASSVTFSTFAAFSGLSSNTTYYLRASAYSLYAGTWTAAADLGSTRTYASPPLSPTLSSVAFSSITLSWDPASDPAGTSYAAELSSDNFSNIKSSSRTANAWAAFTGLTSNATYYLRAQAFNSDGSGTAYTSVFTTSTLAALPLSAAPSGVSTNSITANWYANGNRLGTLYTARISTDSFATVNASRATQNVSAAFSGLLSGTTYDFQVRAQGNDGSSGAFVTLPSTRTIAVVDVSSPSVPAGLGATVAGRSQIGLSWTASTDDVGVAGYNIYRDSVKIATAAATSYSDTGLSPSTTYTYAVSAYDSSANTSALSAGASAATLSAAASTSRVGMQNGVPTIFINERTSAPTSFVVYNQEQEVAYSSAAWLSTFEAYVDKAKSAGLTYVFFNVYLHSPMFATPTQPQPGAIGSDIDWGKMDALFDYAQLKGVYLLPQIKTTSPPEWWAGQNPDKLQIGYDELSPPSDIKLVGASYNNPSYWQVMDAYIQVMVERYKQHPALLGWSPTVGITAENNYGPSYLENIYDPPTSWADSSPYAKQRFRDWLTEKYHTDQSSVEPPLPSDPITSPTSSVANGAGETRQQMKDWLAFRVLEKSSDTRHFVDLVKSLDPDHIIAIDPSDALLSPSAATAKNGTADGPEWTRYSKVDLVKIDPRISCDETPGPFNTESFKLFSFVAYARRLGKIATFALEDNGSQVAACQGSESYDRISKLAPMLAAAGGGAGWNNWWSDNELAKIAGYDYLFDPANRSASPPKIAMLFDPKSEQLEYTLGNAAGTGSRNLDRKTFYSTLYSSGVQIDPIESDEVDADATILNAYKGVVVANMARLSTSTAQILRTYAQNNGGLFVAGRTGFLDPDTGNGDSSALKILLGLSSAPVLNSDSYSSWSFATANGEALLTGLSGQADTANTYYIPTADWSGAGYRELGHAAGGAAPATILAKDRTIVWFPRINPSTGTPAVSLLQNWMALLDDHAAPTTPSGLTTTAAGSSKINLSWTASTDNMGVAGYSIYRDSVKIATAATTSYADVNLAAATTFTYSVSAFDAAGNESAQSGAVSARTDSSSPLQNGDSPFGIHNPEVPTAAGALLPGVDAYSDLPLAGAKWVRHAGALGLVWDMVEKSTGTYDWTQTDYVFGQTYANGLNMMISVAGTNGAWGQPTGYLPTNTTAYANFLKAAVERYDGDGYQDAPGSPVVKYWQIDGEEDNTWKDTADNYAKYLKLSYDAIKAADPDAKVLIGGMGGPQGYYSVYVPIFDALNARYPGQKAFDIVDLHWSGQFLGDYSKELYPGATYYLKPFLADVRAKLGGMGYQNVPIWITEMSSNDGAPADIPILGTRTENDQAKEVVKRYVYSLAAGVEKVFWVTLTEWHDFGGGGASNYFDLTGLINNPRNDGLSHKKLGYYAYKKMAEKLEGSDWSSIETVQEQAGGAYAYKFTKNGRPVWVAWNDAGADATISIAGVAANGALVTSAVPGSDSGLNVTDYATAFSTRTAAVSGGVVAITVSSRTPVFVEYYVDIASPTVPSGLIATPVSSSTIDLSWSASTDDVGVAGYNVHRGGVRIASVTATSYADIGLSPGAIYSYSVAAYDAAGNVSVQSVAASTTTAAAPPAVSTSPFAAVATTGLTTAWSANGNPTGTTYYVQLSSAPGFSPIQQSSRTLALSVAFSGLSPNTSYYAQAAAFDPQTSTWTAFVALGSTATAAAAPASPAFSAVFFSSLTFSWSAAGNPPDTVYLADVSTDSFASVADSSATTGTSADFQSLGSNTTCYLRVRTRSRGGSLSSAVSASTSTLAAPPTSASPSGVGETAVIANWGAGGNRAGTLYEAQSSTDAFASLSGSSLTANTSALFSGLASNAPYAFRVRARGNDGTAAPFTTLPSTTTLPASPGLAGTPFPLVALTSVTAQWTSGGNGTGTTYEATISTDNFGTVNASSSTQNLLATFPGLSADTTYYFQVRSVSGQNSSTNLHLGTAATLAYAPSGTAVLGVSSTTVILDWSASGNPEPGTRYELWRDAGSGFSSAVVTVVSTSGATVAGLSPKTTYYFKVRAFNHAGVYTDFDSVVSTMTWPPAPGRPGTPAGSALGVSSMTWSWTAAQDGQTYKTYRASNTASLVASTPTLSYVDAGLSTNTAYGIVVAGSNPSGEGPLSAPATVYTLAAPPAGTSVSAVSATSATISWTLNTNPTGTTAEVQRSTDNAVFASLMISPVTSMADYGLIGCTTYYVRVRNRNGDDLPSAFDSTIQFKTLASTPLPPGSLAADSLVNNKIALSWQPSATEGIVQYRLYGDNGTGTVDYGSPLAVFTSTESSWTTGSLVSSAAYTFALRAKHRCGVEETGGVFALAGSTGALANVRTSIKAPDSGNRVSGNRITVIAELTSGTAEQVGQVSFQSRSSGGGAWANLTAVEPVHPNPDPDAPYFIHVDVTGWAPGSYDLRAVAVNIAGSSDTAPSAVTVTVDPVSADIHEDLGTSGKVEKRQTVSNAVTSTIWTAGSGSVDPVVKVVLPAGALTSSTITVTAVSNPVITTAPPAGFAFAGSAVQIDLSNGQSALLGGLSASVTLSYPPETSAVSGLTIKSLDPATGAWSAIGSPSVDAINHSVTATTPHLSLFAVINGGSAASDLSGVRVYPVPYKPSGSNPDEGKPYSAGDATSGIIFDRLPQVVAVKIYTLTGRLVARFDTSDCVSGKIQWDAKNADGRAVASGGYFAVVASPGHKSVVKKLVIIR